jgi:type IV pili sensor histidine kinase/response regulator
MIKTQLTLLLALFTLNTIADTQIDRYTIIQDIETQSQANPLDVVVNIKFPKNVVNVKQAIAHLLKRSGYKLDPNYESVIIDKYILPHVHRQIGPIKLKRAIEVLLGKSWLVQIDDLNRTIQIVKNGENPLKVLEPDTNMLIAAAIKKDVLDEIIMVHLSYKEKLANAFKKILPPDWKEPQFANEEQKDIVLGTIISENKTREQVIKEILAKHNLIGFFYKKLKLLAIKDNTKVIK